MRDAKLLPSSATLKWFTSTFVWARITWLGLSCVPLIRASAVRDGSVPTHSEIRAQIDKMSTDKNDWHSRVIRGKILRKPQDHPLTRGARTPSHDQLRHSRRRGGPPFNNDVRASIVDQLPGAAAVACSVLIGDLFQIIW